MNNMRPKNELGRMRVKSGGIDTHTPTSNTYQINIHDQKTTVHVSPSDK